MNVKWLKNWNDKFSKKEFAYGIEPNTFLKKHLDNLKLGRILFGAEGEGRNAVYAAKQGWEVSAFDISLEGKKKAIHLAELNEVKLDYKLGELPNLEFKDSSFDAIALIYAHFPPEIRKEYFSILNDKLKEGGIILFEAFGTNHIEYKKQNPNVGGPSDFKLLFSVNEIKSYFENYDILELLETEVELNEGLFHNGKGSVIRFIGKKK